MTLNGRIMTDILTEKEMKTMLEILNYLQFNNAIDNAKGRELTGKSATTVKRYLGKLCDVGVLKAEGTTKNTTYKKMAES